MKERPILFSGPMVRAILDGSKTQTRRIVKLDISGRISRGGRNWHLEDPNVVQACPYGQPGDRLWVRETFVQGYETDPVTDSLIMTDAAGNELPKTTWYRATDDITWADEDGWETNVPWSPSIHMPRVASRIDRLIKSVRVERLHDISDADSIAEGVDRTNTSIAGYARQRYMALWEATYGAGSWEANPWVWVIGFERIKP